MDYPAPLCVDLGVSTGDDFGFEGDSVGEGLLVGEATDFEDKALGDILVNNFEMERAWGIEVRDDANVRDRGGGCC
jgi:hypothetical protein